MMLNPGFLNTAQILVGAYGRSSQEFLSKVLWNTDERRLVALMAASQDFNGTWMECLMGI